MGGSPRVSGDECVTAESGNMEKTADKNRMQVHVHVRIYKLCMCMCTCCVCMQWA